ncbi:MAG: hypothetical protein JST68_20745 [Bacteroidetes bacterium]|nr:hypothetical protein [Bacteroidota bacterium]
MLNLNAPLSFWGQLAHNIKIRLVDETGRFVDPLQLKEIDYLARFQNKAVVNKVYNQMLADKRSGVIEVYQDKIVVKEN